MTYEYREDFKILHCYAYVYNNESKEQSGTAGGGENQLTFRWALGTDRRVLREKWLIAIGRPKENVPK